MTRMHKDNHALRATHHEGMHVHLSTALCHIQVYTYLFCLCAGLLDLLNDMNATLEAIQKSLDMYLETKRQCFPRFYFLSNDDLLEILGQSKNPEAVSALHYSVLCTLQFAGGSCVCIGIIYILRLIFVCRQHFVSLERVINLVIGSSHFKFGIQND